MNLWEDITINQKRAIARSYAKINLTLDITGLRPDGYHLIRTVMQTVNLSDIVIIDRTPGEIKISTNKKFLPTNNKNIAYKAAEAFYKALGKRGGAKILIHKNIPVAAGLAGGSGNGAAVLAGLNMLWGEPLSYDRLFELALGLGADVPYCLTGGTKLAEGIGELLTPLPPIKKTYVLLVTPPVSVSTPEIYSAYDREECSSVSASDMMTEAISRGDYAAICKGLSNALEIITQKKYPVIRGIKEKMILNGADGALMSGSGPTVFGFFSDYKKAKASHDSFSAMYKDVYLTTTL